MFAALVHMGCLTTCSIVVQGVANAPQRVIKNFLVLLGRCLSIVVIEVATLRSFLATILSASAIRGDDGGVHGVLRSRPHHLAAGVVVRADLVFIIRLLRQSFLLGVLAATALLLLNNSSVRIYYACDSVGNFRLVFTGY